MNDSDISTSPIDELAAAADLLAATSDRELDRVLTGILRSAARPAEDLATSAPGRALRDILRREVRGALPALGGPSGMTLAEHAGAVLGLEAEGLSPQGVEFEVARQLARYATAAGQELAQAGDESRPLPAARAAARAAARRFAPGLPSHDPHHHRSPTGGDMTSQFRADPYGEAEGYYAEADAYGEASVYGEGEAEAEGYYGEAEAEGYYGEAENGYREAEGDQEQEGESPLSEEEVIDYASELVAVDSEQQLDELFGRIFRDVTRRAGRLLKSGVGRQLGGLLKGVVRQALPVAGGALGSFLLPGIGTALGSQLGAAAGGMFEADFEGMDSEDQQLEIAQKLVSLAAGSAQRAVQASPAAPPAAIAQRAFADAAQRYAPGLVGQAGGRRRSGRWIRRGNRIIVLGA